jgi:hypothetical protein
MLQSFIFQFGLIIRLLVLFVNEDGVDLFVVEVSFEVGQFLQMMGLFVLHLFFYELELLLKFVFLFYERVFAVF